MFKLSGSKHERRKFLLLTLVFIFVIGAYTIAKEMKDVVFASIVGPEYLPRAKTMVVFLLIPAAMLYSRLVDAMRRYQLFSAYALVYAGLSLIFGVFLGHPTIGLANTDTSPYRWFGWIMYFVFEGFSPYVVGVFWAFANSISSPKEAKNNYAFMVAGSKLGGMATAIFGWFILSHVHVPQSWFTITHIGAHQMLMFLVAILLILIPCTLYALMKTVPGHYLHGYEAVYQLEKKKQKAGKATTGILSGIKMMLSEPYTLGIFSLIFFYEVLSVFISYQRIVILKKNSHFGALMFHQRFVMHLVGFVLSMFGARYIVKKLGERISLIMVPLLVSGLLIYLGLNSDNTRAVLIVFIILGSINYSLSHPLREALYIPTTKDIKFKSKSWIDSFGNKISKVAGSGVVQLSQHVAMYSPTVISLFYSGFFAVLMASWLVSAFFLGRRYEYAVKHNKAIGNGN